MLYIEREDAAYSNVTIPTVRTIATSGASVVADLRANLLCQRNKTNIDVSETPKSKSLHEKATYAHQQASA